MAYIFAFNQQTGSGGGGGLTINGFDNYVSTKTAPFAAGFTIPLPHTPVDPQSVQLDYNGQVKVYGDDFTVSGNLVTINFGEIYTYEDDMIFQFYYAY